MEHIYTNFIYEKLEFHKILMDVAGFARSEEGKKCIEETKPQTSIEAVRQMHLINSEFKSFYYNEERLTINVIYTFKKQLEYSTKNIVLEADALYELAYSVNLYFALLKQFKKPQYAKIKSLFMIENLETEFYKSVLKYIDHDGNIDSKASKELREIRNEIGNVESKIRRTTDTFVKTAREKNYIADDIVTFRDGFTCVAVKANIKNKIDGIILDYSATGQTAYVVPRRVIELTNELAHLKDEEKKEIFRILKGYTETVKLYVDDLRLINESLLNFDIYHAKARYTLVNDLFSPIITDELKIEILDGRHPLLGKDAIPLTVKLGDGFRILVITGPNTGGKTVALKTIGLFAMMVQSGIPIPASSASKFCILENIFVDIGDEQSIEMSLSTFSAHIKKTIEILEKSNDKTLVLIDEFGAGTDPIEGSALAMSILHSLREKGSLVMITTHYTALKHFAAQEDDIENGSMEFDSINLQPTYHLNIGIPGSSKALEISKRLGMPEAVIYRAKFNLDKDYLNVEKLTRRLEDERFKIQDLRLSLESKEKELKQALEKLEADKDALSAREADMKEQLQRQESDFLKESRKEFENLVRLIKTEGAKKEYIKDGKLLFDKIQENVKEQDKVKKKRPKKKKVVIENLEVGDDVKIVSKNIRGTIVGRTNNKDEFLVQAGLLKVNIKAEDLRLVQNKNIQQQQHKFNYSYESSSRPDASLDLRGCRFEEAERKIDRFIEQAAAHKIRQVKVIHGMGTGAIRKCIHDFFKTSSYVEEFHYEKMAQSDSTNFGTTVATLRF